MNEVLRAKLEEFIRRYYQNRLLKGLFYALGLGATYYLVITGAELFGRFPGSVRAALFFALLGGLLFILIRYLLIPLFKLAGIGKRLSYEDAARIIGRHFPEVDDKLLNTIQLQGIDRSDSDLLKASIDQRIAQMQPVPFKSAIDLGENKKYWPLLVAPVLIIALIALSGNWDEFNQSSRRIAEFNREFVPEAPFSFVLENNDLRIEEGQDLEIILGFSGVSLPDESYIQVNGREVRMSRREDGRYSYRLSKLSRDLSFRFQAAGYLSGIYEVEVIPVPRIRNMQVNVVPPAYTRIKPFVTGVKPVLDIPEGSEVTWQLDLDQAREAHLISNDNQEPFANEGASGFFLRKRVVSDLDYSVELANEAASKQLIRDHRLDVIKDGFPDIEVAFTRDSLARDRVFIEGSIADDYGFSKLELIVEGEGVSLQRIISINKNVNTAGFADLLLLDSLAGDESRELSIFLKVWDNDEVNGAKSAISDMYRLRILGRKEREKQFEEEYKNYLSGSDDMQRSQDELERQLSEMQKDLQGKKNLDWQDKNKLKELLRKQQELLQKQQEREQKLQELKEKEKELGKENEELKKKEEDIDKITPEDKELEELMKEIEELLEKLDTERLKEKLEKMQEMNQQNQDAMDRKDDLLKDLKFQKDVLEQAQKLKELGIKMKELARDVEQDLDEGQDKDEEELARQEQLEEEFRETMEKVDELREQNEKFDKEADEEGLDEQEEQTESEMNESREKLQKQESQPANQNQQKAGESMEKMSESLQMAMMNMQSKQNQENMETLRQILENLKILSFSIEDLSAASKETGRNDPAFRSLLTEQKRLMDGTRIIEDSLKALGKRVPELEQVVFEELAKIDKNLEEGVQRLEELQSAQAAANQQMVMTSANNLALLLDETMQSMMQAQAQMMKGNQNCQKPGGGSPKPSMQNLRKMQGELGQKMDQLKKGKQEGKGKDGERMSKEIVEMISRQEQIRQALEGMMKDMEGQGTKGDLQKAIEDMKELERDLWDGELDGEYKERLKNIETRLLESEKAELKQKKEERRESESAKDRKQIYEEELEKYLKEKGIERENIDRVPVNFRLYYRDRTTDYLKSK